MFGRAALRIHFCSDAWLQLIESESRYMLGPCARHVLPDDTCARGMFTMLVPVSWKDIDRSIIDGTV